MDRDDWIYLAKMLEQEAKRIGEHTGTPRRALLGSLAVVARGMANFKADEKD